MPLSFEQQAASVLARSSASGTCVAMTAMPPACVCALTAATSLSDEAVSSDTVGSSSSHSGRSRDEQAVQARAAASARPKDRRRESRQDHQARNGEALPRGVRQLASSLEPEIVTPERSVLDHRQARLHGVGMPDDVRLLRDRQLFVAAFEPNRCRGRRG